MTERKSVRPFATVVSPPAYEPDVEAYGRDVPCPDRDPHEIMADGQCLIDARLWEGKFETTKTGHVRLAESRVTPRLGKERVQQHVTKLREGSGDWFAFGVDQLPQTAQEGPLTQNYVPAIPGPATRQQYWADYFTSSAKCFEAFHHSGVAKRACCAMVQFPLGRGVIARVKDQAARDAWDAFWDGNKMDDRIRGIARDLSIFGEQFLRYFPVKKDDEKLLAVRSLDPATIYEIVTDQEDIEAVYFYHQQFQTQMELFSPPTGNKAVQGATPTGVTLYIIRQIDSSEIDHYKVNCVESEKRGRSDLFPALGDLKRLRDLMTSKVLRADVLNRMMAVLQADGTPADVARMLANVFPGGQAPAPGSVIGINKATELTAFEFHDGGGGARDHTYTELVNLIAVATGIAKEYLGVTSDGATRANALVATEPTTKVFDERQKLLEGLLHDMFERVMVAAGVDPDSEREFMFPAIAEEDRSAKLQDLEIAEANQWISKRTAASTAAQELGVSTYDFDGEQKLVASEFADALDEEKSTGEKDPLTGLPKPAKPKQGDGVIRRPSIRATSRQATKLDPTKSQSMDDEPPGLLVPMGAGATVPGQAPNGATPPANGATPATRAGIPANQNPAAPSGAATLKKQSESDIVLSQDQLGALLREAYASGRAPRRKPDDPMFKQHAAEFQAQTAENLERLLKDVEVTT